MNNSLRTILIILISIIISGITVKQSSASPAYPGVINYKQANGTTIKIQLMGDEFVRWALTEDGYTLLMNSQGNYEYAIKDANGDIQPSGVVASNISERSNESRNLLRQVEKGLYYSKEQVSMLKSIWKMKENEQSRAFPTTGNRKLICILMGYKDKAFTKTKSDFNNLFNQVGYSTGGATGSVKDFYLENSWGDFNLTVDVFGPYTASQNMSYYGGNNSYGNDANPRALVTEAVNLADPEANYANYDNDNDGTVDGVYVIYAGYGEEAGGGTNCIWAHAWNISSVVKDGKTISKYSCSAELRGSYGSTITAIGVICHEFGHVLGAPDYYDTDYSTGGQYQGTGEWDLMASGSWNNSGVTPAHHNAYTKTKVYKWATPTILDSPTDVSVLNVENNKSFYQINSTTSNEYWLIENRQKVGFDQNIPGHGMMIYHVHSGVVSASTSNNINNTYPQKMYPVCASATSEPGSSSSSYGSINSEGCPYPGSSSVVSFTDATTPSMKSWAGANTGKPITNIAESTSTKTITFTFMNGGGGGGTVTEYKLPFTENFNSSTLPNDWSTINTGSGITERWSASNTNKAGGSAYEMMCKWQNVNPATTMLVTPAINTKGVSQVKFSFRHMLDAYSSGVTLRVKTSNDKSNWTNTSWVVNSSTTNINATTVEIDITNNLNAEKTYFAIVAEGNLYQIDYWYVDNVSIVTSTAPAQDPVVTTTTPSSITINSAVCGGDVVYSNSSAITERGICYSTMANPTTSGSIVTSGSGSGSFTANLTNLSSNTKYYVKAYAKTSSGTYYGSEKSFTTLSQSVSYCSSKGNNSTYEWIDLVRFAGIDRTSGNDGGYKDMTSMKANVAIGSTYPIYISAGFKGTAYTEYWAVWIDYNQDGVFADSEKVTSGSSSSSSNLTANVTIPSDAVQGVTRMRVSMKYNSAQTACETFSYGEVEDYSVEISNTTPSIAFDFDNNAKPLTFTNEETLSIYPNPANDIIRIKSDNLQANIRANIFNGDGVVVKQVELEGRETIINISNLKRGVYYIHIYDEKEPIVRKIIKL